MPFGEKMPRDKIIELVTEYYNTQFKTRKFDPSERYCPVRGPRVR